MSHALTSRFSSEHTRSTTATVATWNILGRRSAQTKAMAKDNAISELVAMYAIDILCMQEAHFHNGRPEEQLVRELSSAGLTHHEWLPLSDSHIDPDAALGIGIASRHPLSAREDFVLSNPGLRARVRGEDWVLHDKGMVGCLVDLPGTRPIRVYSLHLFPFHEFGVSEDDDRVGKMWAEFWAYLDTHDDDRVILAGDFNQERKVTPSRRWGGHAWSFHLDDTITTSFGLSLDAIATSWVSPSAKTWAVPTFSDHHLAIARIEL